MCILKCRQSIKMCTYVAGVSKYVYKANVGGLAYDGVCLCRRMHVNGTSVPNLFFPHPVCLFFISFFSILFAARRNHVSAMKAEGND